MSMYRVLCVNSLWCSQNMCDLAWLVSLNKTLLLNRMWGYIMGGARFASHKFYHPLPDHTGAVPTFLETRFFNFPGCRHDTAWAILVRNSASLPCLGWHKGWVHLWKFGGGGWTWPNVLQSHNCHNCHRESLAVWSESQSKMTKNSPNPKTSQNVDLFYIDHMYKKKQKTPWNFIISFWYPKPKPLRGPYKTPSTSQPSPPRFSRWLQPNRPWWPRSSRSLGHKLHWPWRTQVKTCRPCNARVKPKPCRGNNKKRSVFVVCKKPN